MLVAVVCAANASGVSTSKGPAADEALLAQVLDATNLVFKTGGDAFWSPEAYDFNAAVSGMIQDNESSWIESTVTGPGIIKFRWQVSSEPSGDFLRFYIGGTEVTNISGELTWREEAFVIPDSQQTVRWEYAKNSTVTSGNDHGILDRVSVRGGDPQLIEHPQRFQTVVPGDTVAFRVCAVGIPPPTYQWSKDGVTIPGATNSILLLHNVQTPDSTLYGHSVKVSNSLGYFITAGARWVLASPVSLAEALDNVRLDWSTGGSSPWLGIPRGGFPVAHDGIDTAKTGLITDDNETWIQTTVSGPGIVRFWWKVSSEKDSDFLSLSVGDTEVTRISGEWDWRRESVTIPAGEQRLRWKYSKNQSGSEGIDRGWVDQVEIIGIPAIIASPENRTVWEGANVTFHVSAVDEHLLKFQWLKNGIPLSGYTSSFLSLTNVSSVDAGKYSAVLSNEVGSVTTAPATLIVESPSDGFVKVLAGPPTVSLQVNTAAGRRYLLESADALSSPAWNIVGSIVGDGMLHTLTDPRPAEVQRFYRVRMEPIE